MRLVAVLLAIVFVGALVAIWLNGRSLSADWLSAQDTTEARVEAKWEPIFFRSIRERISEIGVPDLRTVRLRNDDFELRVWVGFGINGNDALILRHSSNQWSAVHLHGMGERPPFVTSLSNPSEPRSGWNAAWRKLTDAGLLTLPDALAVNCNTHMFDGKSYVVEINKDTSYRTYLYDNPHHASCKEAKQMLAIGDIIADEFGLKEFQSRALDKAQARHLK